MQSVWSSALQAHNAFGLGFLQSLWAPPISEPCSWGMQTTLHRPAPLTVTGVFAALRQMAVEKGPGSAGRRQRSVLALLRSCRSVLSLQYLFAGQSLPLSHVVRFAWSGLMFSVMLHYFRAFGDAITYISHGFRMGSMGSWPMLLFFCACALYNLVLAGSSCQQGAAT